MEVLIFLGVLAIPVAILALIVVAVLKPEARVRLREASGRIRRSVPGRLILLTTTLILLLVPLFLLDELRRERSSRLHGVEYELSEQWGGAQQVVGPFLHVPVIEHYEERREKLMDDGTIKVWMTPMSRHRDFLLMPDSLVAKGAVSPRRLHRGLYDVLVYDAQVDLEAVFSPPEIPDRLGRRNQILWDEARLVVELSNLSSVAAVRELSWQQTPLKVEAVPLGDVASHERISGLIKGFDGDQAIVKVGLDLRGMDQLHVGPVAEENTVDLEGTWHAPSFSGFTLPADRNVTDEDFTAQWKVPGVARPIPALHEGLDGITLLRNATVGVDLVDPASPYASVERAQEYGMLVIILCLLTFLFLEQGMGLSLHPVQWLVNGLGMTVFYLVLLSTSEHWGFVQAYLMASGLTVGLLSLYLLAVTRSLRVGAAVVPVLSGLYGCMFAMLRSEDHALLLGTGLIVLALMGLMWVTRTLTDVAPPDAMAPT